MPRQMLRRLALAAALLAGLSAPAAAQATSKQFTVGNLDAQGTFAFKSQVVRANESITAAAYVDGKPLKQAFIEVNGRLAMVVRGHGVTVTFIARQKRSRVRVEVSNFRHRPVKVVIRIYAVALKSETGAKPNPEDKAAARVSAGR